MEMPKKSQLLKLSTLLALLLVTPLLPTSLRSTYLYFLFNLLVIALGAEAGLLSSFSKSPEDRKPQLESSPRDPQGPAERSPNAPKAVEKCSSEKIVGSASKLHKAVKKCSSTPSLFFIGGGESEEPVECGGGEEDGEEEEGGGGDDEVASGISGQELFTKAETFIGNFYNQLKMQREESWKRIHGFYHKAF